MSDDEIKALLAPVKAGEDKEERNASLFLAAPSLAQEVLRLREALRAIKPDSKRSIPVQWSRHIDLAARALEGGG